ncbi:endospore germination permease [Bacillus sp. FJAT-45350]|uniref:endospore germination permease n=1 Tax=Bacillus sp. FJAT-45350 TaxID=2011014 RepID=UPI000BB94CAF|nr:endospore germination permease [Bacillus sp. FJAT-45350]
MTFSRIQILFVLLLFIGISNHVLIVPHLLGAAKRDAWLCVLISYGVLLLWIGVYSFIFSRNKQRQPLSTWIEFRAGKVVSKIIIFLFMAYIILIAFIAFFDFIVSVKIYFLPLTPTWVVVIPFLLLSIWAASTSIKTIVYTSALLLPIVWALGHFVAFSTMDGKDYSYLFPILADDEASISKGVVIILGGSVDLLLLFLLQQYFKKPVSYLYLFLLVTFLMGLVIGPTIGSITAFGPFVAADLRFPAFEQWRLVSIGEHISHVDALAVFQLISGAIIRVSLCFYLLPDVMKVQSIKVKRAIIILFATVLAVGMLIHISDIWIQTILINYFYPSVLLFGICVTLLLVIISYLPVKKGTHSA